MQGLSSPTPLSLYLLTFILTFDSDRWYSRRVMAPLLGITALFVFTCSSAPWFKYSAVVQVLANAASLFCCGMVCHGELVSRKPAAAQLTGFYLLISLGGALGGLFVALLAPLLFDTYVELDIGLVACLGAVVFAIHNRRVTSRRQHTAVAAVVVLAGLVVGISVRLQVGGENACFVAFDLKTGEERWKALNDNASYSAPIIIEQAGKRVMVCWTGDNIVGLTVSSSPTTARPQSLYPVIAGSRSSWMPTPSDTSNK